MYRGGGEAVCVQTIEALKGDYDVTLMTVGEEIDFAKLNDYFGTSLGAEEVDVLFLDTHPIKEIRAVLKYISDALPFDTELLRLKTGISDRKVSKLRGEYDLLISTQCETPFQKGVIDYIHFPFHPESAEKYGSDLEYNRGMPFYSLYDRLVDYLRPKGGDGDGEKSVLVNSQWTGEVVTEAYGLQSRVLYPPVRIGDFSAPPLSQREDGIVCVGRVETNKRILRNIEIIDELNEDYDLHLHVVGNISDTTYGRQVKERARGKSYIQLEGRVPRERLIEIIESHKFGIHGMDAEHFGIAVAEMVAGGCISFVPNDGGQVEIVGENPDLVYEDKGDAVAKISRMLDNPDLQASTRSKLEGREELFSAERFKKEMAEIVAEEV